MLASGNILLTPFPELKFKSTLTLDHRNAVNTTFLDPISTAWGRNQYGEASDNRNMNTVLTFDNVLICNKTSRDMVWRIMVHRGRIQTIQIAGSMAPTIVAIRFKH